MVISYAGKKIKKLCEDDRYAKQRLGSACAKGLQKRIDDLQAASHIGELVAGKPHPLAGNPKCSFALWISKSKRLVFEPMDRVIPELEDGSIDRSKITKVKIVFIGDYHDG